MRPTQGVPRNRRLQHHILRKCSKYLNVSQALMPPPPRSTTPSVRTAPRLPTPLSSPLEPTPTPPSSLPPSAAPHKPIPKKCKKRIGTCSHEVVFGQHYDHKEWTIYAEKVRSAKSVTVIDPDYVA